MPVLQLQFIDAHQWQDVDEEECRETITRDETGQFYRNGKLLSDNAIEQRLRRWTATKKSGLVSSGEDAQKMFKDLEQRPALINMYKESGLNKVGH